MGYPVGFAAMWIALAIVAVLLLVVIVLFNRLVRYRNHTRTAWSNVQPLGRIQPHT